MQVSKQQLSKQVNPGCIGKWPWIGLRRILGVCRCGKGQMEMCSGHPFSDAYLHSLGRRLALAGEPIYVAKWMSFCNQLQNGLVHYLRSWLATW